MKHSKRNRLLALALAICLSMSFVLPINAAGLGLGDEDTDVSGVDTYALTMGTKPADGTTTGNPFPQSINKEIKGLNSFRIPAMVTLKDGTIVAAADARWNTTYDGGGLDTIVSRSSDGGATWSYTFANYLGDNGNQYSGSGSTAFIDPALATDGSTIYMLCDLYPYGVALNGSGHTPPSTDVGFDSNNRLLLSNNNHWSYDYYLDGGTIYTSGGAAVNGYKVDEYFNITGTDGTNTNLFFSDSPFKVVRTGYLYLTTSTDKGATWSAPTLLPNIKTSGEQVCLVGPGRGVVTSSNYLIFPVYSYNYGTQKMGFIYRANNSSTWGRIDCDTISGWSSEAAVVALDDTTLRFFYRNGTANLCYVDYTWTNGGQTDGKWGSPVNTGIATNSNTQISAITYSKTVDGQKVLLVSCPTGPNERGSNQSGAEYRLNGKIFVGVVQENKAVEWQTPISVTSNNSQFMYSCLTEHKDGSVSILYEDHQNAWGAGDNCYYTMSYKTYGADKLGLTFDSGSTEETETVKDDTTGVTVVLPKGSTMTAAKVTDTAAITGLTGDWVAYDISINGGAYTASATVTLPIGELANSEGALYGFVVENGVAKKVEGGSKSADGKYFTFTAPHFSVVGVAEQDGITDYKETVSLTVGGDKAVDDLTGDYSSHNGQSVTDANGNVIATITAKYTPGSSDPVKSTITSGNEYYICSGTSYMYILSGNLYGSTDIADATKWTFTGNASDGFTISTLKNATTYYLSCSNTGTISASTTKTKWKYSESDGLYCETTSYGTRYLYYYSYYNSDWTTSYYSRNPSHPYVDGIAEGTTSITFKGLKPGTATVTVGNVRYVIEVSKKTETVTLQPGQSKSYENAGTTIEAQSGAATATIANGTITITAGSSTGTATIVTDTTIYNVHVSNTIPADTSNTPFIGGSNVTTDANGNTVASSNGQKVTKLTTSVGLTFDLDLDSQYGESTVTWSSMDPGIATVDENGKVTGVSAGTTTIIATIDGVSYSIPVVVLYNETYYSDGKYSYYCHLYINEITNTTVNYSINLETNMHEAQEGEAIYLGFDYPFCINFFGKQNDGYALSFMAATNSLGNYYPLYQDVAITEHLAYKEGGLYWQRLQWPNNEGEALVTALLEAAINAGFNGITGFTRTQNNEHAISSLSFRSEKLPTIAKEVESVNGTAYTDGMVANVGDVIRFKITVTKYAGKDAIEYTSIKLSDILAIGDTSNVSGVTLTDASGRAIANGQLGNITIDSTASIDNVETVYYASYTVTASDMEKPLVNTAKLNYTYSSTYSSGTFDASASAEARLSLTDFIAPKDIVIDFGLPVTVTTNPWATNYTGSNAITATSATATYGNVNVSGDNTTGLTITYTPAQVLPREDTVTLTSNRGLTYSFKVHPASNVLYEDDFLTQAAADSGTAWTRADAAAAMQSKDQSTLYGYDDAYKTSTGNSLGSAWTIEVPNSQTVSKFLTTSFYGNGFDLIGTAGPNTGYVYMLLSGNGVNKLVIVDTSYVGGDGSTTLYQVPLVHLENLDEGTYTVNILGAYRAATAAQSAVSAAAYGLYDDGPAAGDGIYAALDKFYEAGYDIDDVELVYFDQSSALAAMNSAAAVYASNASTMAAAESTARPAGNTVTIDGFRVYRDSKNSAYLDAEQNVSYHNILDVVDYNGVGSPYYAVTENSGTYTLTSGTDYENHGGPQNELYLDVNQAVVLQSNYNAGATLQISARAVTGDPTNLNGETINSNTEMYYNVTVGENGVITIANLADKGTTGMLALGNLKFKAGTKTSEVTARTLSIASTMLRSYAAAPDQSEPAPDPTPVIPQPMPVFTPDRLTVGVKSIGLFRTKVNTVAITTSTDVVRLTVNGKELRPTNSLMVQLGLSRYYTYVLVDTTKKNETRSYEVIAYNADGVASKTRIAKG